MVKAKKGDLVKIEFTGKVQKTGQIFDTTYESVAKSAGIYNESALYGPKLAVFGTRAILPGIEEAIIASELGKEEEFTMQPEKAFGKRQSELIRMVSEKEFMKQNFKPKAGMLLALDEAVAKVKSVTSGRVVVDFNHPLAGESVVYSLKVHEVISDDSKKIESILSSFGVKGKVEKKENSFSVLLDKANDKKKEEKAKKAVQAIVPSASFSVS